MIHSKLLILKGQRRRPICLELKIKYTLYIIHSRKKFFFFQVLPPCATLLTYNFTHYIYYYNFKMYIIMTNTSKVFSYMAKPVPRPTYETLLETKYRTQVNSSWNDSWSRDHLLILNLWQTNFSSGQTFFLFSFFFVAFFI